MRQVIKDSATETVSLSLANQHRLICINPVSDIGIVVKDMDEGVPTWYAQWANGIKSISFKSLPNLFDTLSEKNIKIFEI